MYIKKGHTQEKSEDTKGVLRTCVSKDKKGHTQEKSEDTKGVLRTDNTMAKKKNNDPQNITQKTIY